MTLRLTDEEQDALRDRAEAEGISMQEAARKAGANPQVPAPGAPGVTPQVAPPTGAPVPDTGRGK